MADQQSWYEALSRLDFERDCSAGPTTVDNCWLCDKLADWNTVLAPLRLQVVEEIPGYLCLRTRQGNKKPKVMNSAYNPAYFIAWLPRKHRCIVAVKFGQGEMDLDRSTVPPSLFDYTPEIRQVTIGGIGAFDCSSLMDSLGGVANLEALVLDEATVGDPLSVALGGLLVANYDTVRTVSVSRSFVPGGASNTLTEAISRCLNLKELTYNAHLDFQGLKYLKNLIHSADSLEKLCLREALNTVVDPVDDRQNEELLATVAELAQRSASSLDFCYHAYTHVFTSALRGLEASTVLRHLEISKCDCVTGPTVGPLLKCALSSYAGLQSLTFRACEFDATAAELLAGALEENTTLRQLLVFDVIISFPQMQTLLGALEKNKTLQLLQVDFLAASEEQRWVMSEQMCRNDLYTRVQLPWTNSDARYLSAVLGEPWLCPCHLQLNAGRLSDFHFAMLCKALSRRCFVRSLTVSLWQAGPGQVDSLRDALRKNTSIVELKLHDCESSGAAVRASIGLDVNRKVAQLVVICSDAMEPSSAVQFASVLAANQFLCEVELMCSREVNAECMTAMSRGLLQNNTILSFAVRSRCIAECSTRDMEVAVQRNVTRLHRAVRFVLKRDLTKPFAEAFEMCENKESLVQRIMLTSGMSEAEATAAVTSARRFILRNYFTINNVVHHVVECWPGEGTQIDALNYDCWLAISEHLKVSDVLYAGSC
ncbi:uncharacterized protein LOC125760032 [Rhipicephalus sanguineus]|uniref:Uncharacterized protein n=1 Tax=Rhipicephalus sanguineus TaxID=34632 RepID=A0A9D4QC70_RHISA|nr:uncharacterized protein LOC125760032 [Rhipicephalus sanguineus]KAH7975291.1 hypothetical protein HPB52_000006 [Rhipicephalus sanguineus]